jgi:ribosomal 50S subunit-associated protein YjgA (DUF615 family)
MDTEKLKELIQKVVNGTANEEEKLQALKNLNELVEEYNKALKEALAQNPE